MNAKTTHTTEYSTTGAELYLAFELGNKEWKLGFTIGLGQRPRLRTIAAGDLAALEWEIGRAKQRFGLPETAPVVRLEVKGDFLERLDEVRLWDGSHLPAGLRARLEREYAGWEFAQQQVKELEAERAEMIRTSEDASVEQVRQLLRLKAIGENSAWLFVMEFFGWREFRNRREVGGLAGLTPTPYLSGDEMREQGISKAGNRPIP
jgi:hypothetical protein